MDHQAIAETQEQFTRINKKDLLGKIKANREKHASEFSEAFQGWRVALAKKANEYIEGFASDLKEFTDKEKPRFIYSSPRLPPPPINHTDDYDRIITRFEMSLDDTIFLSHSDFDKFVLDQWSWSGEHAHSQLLYVR